MGGLFRIFFYSFRLEMGGYSVGVCDSCPTLSPHLSQRFPCLYFGRMGTLLRIYKVNAVPALCIIPPGYAHMNTFSQRTWGQFAEPCIYDTTWILCGGSPFDASHRTNYCSSQAELMVCFRVMTPSSILAGYISSVLYVGAYECHIFWN